MVSLYPIMRTKISRVSLYGIAPKVHIDVHADRKRARVNQIDKYLYEFTVRGRASGIRSGASWLNARSNGRYLSCKLAFTKSGRSHHHRLPHLDRADI